MRNRLVPSDVMIRPTSATSPLTTFSGFSAFLLALVALKIWEPFDQVVFAMLSVMVATAVGVFLPDILINRLHRLALSPRAAQYSWTRARTKLVGLFSVLAFIGLAYALFPEYDSDFYQPFWQLLVLLSVPWLLLAGPYILWLDARLAEPYDGLWHLGRLCLGHWQETDRRQALIVAMGWVVKGFFWPLMFLYACNDLQRFLFMDLGAINSFKLFYEFMFFFMFFVDVGMVCMGYVCTLRLLDTHIRSVEPTTLGWLVALVCYEPFWNLVGRQYLAYDTGYPWGVWLQDSPLFYALWGSLILCLVFVYVWATVSFGARFSNLTHRGIITHGPYRWSKHPAYLAKNISWWMISVPFLAQDSWWQAFGCCVLLLMVNGIYWIRARTEEAHLMQDPQYREYAQWIANHGFFALLGRYFRSKRR